MAITVTIGGSSYDIKPGTLSITEALGARGTCDFSIDDAAGTLWAPIPGMQVAVNEDAVKIFGGSVETVEMVRTPGITHRILRLSCVDHHRLLDKRLTEQCSYTQTLAGDIVCDLVNQYLDFEGISSIYVEDGPVIEHVEWDYLTVAEAIQQVASLAGMVWYVDHDKYLRFFAPKSTACPFDVTDAENNCESLTMRTSREEYANRITGRFGQYLRDPQTATFNASGRTGTGEETDAELVPDGARRRFPVTYPVNSTPTIKVDGEEKTVGISGVDTGKDWYWSAGSRDVDQDEGASPLASGVVLDVTYVGVGTAVITLQNDAQIFFRNDLEETSGYYEALIDASTQMSRSDAEQFIQSALARSGDHSLAATIRTMVGLEPQAAGARPGQSITLDVSGYGGGGRSITDVDYGAPVVVTAPGHGRQNGEKVRIVGLPGLDQLWTVANKSANSFQLAGSNVSGTYEGGGWLFPSTFLIRQIRKSDIAGLVGPELVYEIEVVAGPLLHDAASYFSSLGAQTVPSTSGQAPSTDDGECIRDYRKGGGWLGDMEVGADPMVWPFIIECAADEAIELTKVAIVAKPGKGPTGDDLIVDGEYSTDEEETWSPLFATTKIVMPDGELYGEQSTFSASPMSLSNGTRLRFPVDQVGSTNPGTNIAIEIRGQVVTA